MSHVSETETQIDSLDALKSACDALGWQFVEGKKTYNWYGRWVGDTAVPDTVPKDQHEAWKKSLGACDHCIKVPGARYEIGVVAQSGKYALRFDYYASGGLLPKIGGKKAERLMDAYNLHRLEAEARRYGWRSERIKAGSKTVLRVHVQG